MPDRFIIIKGSNGYSYNLHTDSDGSNTIVQYNSGSKKISAGAIGSGKRYAVVCENGAWKATAPQKFLDKMNEIRTENIKQMSFGPNATWAIVMKSGWCHASAYHKRDGGPFDAITEHNGNIKYVSMTDNKSEWIVGYGRCGIHRCGLPDDLDGYILGVNNSNKEIYSVELGANKNTWVVHTENYWKWSATNNVDNKMRDANDKRLAVVY
eukprot:351173_1